MKENQFFEELKTSLGLAIKELATFSAQDIKELGLQMHLTQKSFAALMGVSVKTVESWEHGANQPSGAARRLLEILSNQPYVAEDQQIVSV